MNPEAAPLATGALILAGLGAAILLRQAWRRRSRPWLIAGGWLLIAAAAVGAAPYLGSARGPFTASALISTAALALVAFGVQVRDPKGRAPRELALEPSDRPSKAWRGWLRAILAGPLGGIAAMGVGLAWAVWAPGDQQTRLVIGGMLVPLLWAAGMAWTLSDDKILRATAVLTGVAVVTFTASALRGFS